MKVALSDEEIRVIGNALDVAAEQFAKDAKACSATPRLVEQFERQAKACKVLSDKLTREGAPMSY